MMLASNDKVFEFGKSMNNATQDHYDLDFVLEGAS